MQAHSKIIHVVSLGVDDSSSLNKDALLAIQQAQLIIGTQHHFDSIKNIKKNLECEEIAFPSPFSDLIKTIKQHIDKSVVILASGDALFYGVGALLSKQLANEQLIFHPNVSSMQVAFHRAGLAWQNARIHSLHGRPLSTLNQCLQHNALLGLFTDETSNPAAIAQHLVQNGYGTSEVWVGEDLGSKKEVIQAYTAQQLQTIRKAFSTLTICIVKCIGHNACFQGMLGIADNCFDTGSAPGKGMISKREVRLSILSAMESYPNDIAWDIGAGCGSVSIEWARQNKTATIYAIENNEQRMTYLKINAKKMGVELNVKPVSAMAPEACNTLPQPDVIFIGGNGGHLAEILDYSMAMLKQGGRLVVSAVAEKSITLLKEFANKHQQLNGEFIELNVSKTNDLATIDSLRQLKTVSILKLVKN